MRSNTLIAAPWACWYEPQREARAVIAAATCTA